MTTFGNEERRILSLLSCNQIFNFNDETFIILKSGKPTCPKGEPKTDIYIKAENINHLGENIEIKISFKKENADFIENKTNAERAEQLLGPNWQVLIQSATNSKRHLFMSRNLVYKIKKQRTNEGSITLGWKFELVNKLSGDLSGLMPLSRTQVLDVYSGTNLSIDKKNAYINGEVIANSGIANYILINDYIMTTQDVIDNLIPIEEYVNANPNVYFACKALNYRTIEEKWDGNRPLAVYVDWRIVANKLTPIVKFDNPLNIKGDSVANNLVDCLRELGISNAHDINSTNFSNPELIHPYPTITINS
ncbi:hypothetical protein [Jeotgalibaca sp. A122]|uniref:hypothetical protein n=1 Tax=Jeotgalibaca sp. A122 TaxID=3457322 RepID=UPI003FD49774